MIDESNNSIKNDSTLGPLREGHRFTSTCEVRGTRPAPLVGWYRAGKRLTGNFRNAYAYNYDMENKYNFN